MLFILFGNIIDKETPDDSSKGIPKSKVIEYLKTNAIYKFSDANAAPSAQVIHFKNGTDRTYQKRDLCDERFCIRS